MKTFYEWLDEQHPEYNEGALDYLGRKGGMARDTMTKFVLPATAALGIGMALDGNRGNNGNNQNRPAAIQRADVLDNEEFITYAAQQVERQLGGSQDARIPEPKGWNELGEDIQDKIYSIALDALIKQYEVKDQEDLQRMFDRETIQGRYDGSNPYKIGR
jgi:hypothetical protein